jgi:hypothetical protein
MNFNIDASYMPILFIYIFALTLFCIGLIVWVYVIDSKRTAEKKAKTDDLVLDQLKQLFHAISGEELKTNETMIKEERRINTPDLHANKSNRSGNFFNKFIGGLSNDNTSRINSTNLAQPIELLITKLDLMIEQNNKDKVQLSAHIARLEKELYIEKCEAEKVKAVFTVLEEKLKSELELTIKQYETMIDTTTKANSVVSEMLIPSSKNDALTEQSSHEQSDSNEITASLFDDNAKQDVIRLNKEIETLQIGYEAQSLEYETIVDTMKMQLSDLKTEYEEFMERYQMMSSEKIFIEQAYLAEQVQ